MRHACCRPGQGCLLVAEPWRASVPFLCLRRTWPLPPTFRVQVARWQPRPWVGTALLPSLGSPVGWPWPPQAATGSFAACPSLVARRCSNSQGRDPRTPDMLIRALSCVRVAPNSQRRGLSTPSSASRMADQLGSGLAAPLTQTARGGDPRTPRGLLAHLRAFAPHVALRARLLLFRSRLPLPCPWAAAMAYRVAAGAAALLRMSASKCGYPALLRPLCGLLHGHQRSCYGPAGP